MFATEEKGSRCHFSHSVSLFHFLAQRFHRPITYLASSYLYFYVFHLFDETLPYLLLFSSFYFSYNFLYPITLGNSLSFTLASFQATPPLHPSQHTASIFFTRFPFMHTSPPPSSPSLSYLQERRRLKAKYPSVTLKEEDEQMAKTLLASYYHSLSVGEMCEGNCAPGVTCPRGICHPARR